MTNLNDRTRLIDCLALLPKVSTHHKIEKLRKVRISSNFKLEFINNLKKIGYYFDNKKKTNFAKVIKAFQRHYRKKLINGIIDKECLLISKNILKKI